MKQQELPFDICENRHGGNPESVTANLRITASKDATRRLVYEYIKSCGQDGATADEVVVRFASTHNHIAPRISELKAMHAIVATTERRETRTGCKARVLVART